MNRFGYRTRIRYRAVGVGGGVPPPPPLFGRKLKTKGDYHFTIGNTELIKAHGLLVNNTTQFPFRF